MTPRMRQLSRRAFLGHGLLGLAASVRADDKAEIIDAHTHFYGSNWPVSERSAGYGTLFGIVREYFGGDGAGGAARFFAANARDAYQL
jgi:hypothetical protein